MTKDMVSICIIICEDYFLIYYISCTATSGIQVLLVLIKCLLIPSNLPI